MPALSPRQIQDRLAAVERTAGVTVTDVVRRTDKALLAKGRRGHEPVAVKVLLDGDDYWRAKFAHESAVYRAFAAYPPPVRVPRVLFSDDEGVIVMTWLDGQPVGNGRYLDESVSSRTVDAVLAVVRALNTWQSPPGTFRPVLDYRERIDRYLRRGFLTDADAAALGTLLARHEGRWEFNHGDLLPTNLLMTPDGRCAPLDWEFGGNFLPGFDLAFLHTTMATAPYAQRRIEDIVAAEDITGPYLLNQAMVLTRELRIHTELPPSSWRDQRVHTITYLWQDARHRIQQATAEGQTR